ncbi:MAG: hypothetical protein AB8F65_12245 [Woeseiaceae bacterium]
MNQRQSDPFRLFMQAGPSRPASLLARVGSVIVGVVVFVFAIIAGGVLLMAFLALAAALAAVFGIRMWWWKRQMTAGMKKGADKPSSDPSAIEGEYRVVDDD